MISVRKKEIFSIDTITISVKIRYNNSFAFEGKNIQSKLSLNRCKRFMKCCLIFLFLIFLPSFLEIPILYTFRGPQISIDFRLNTESKKYRSQITTSLL